MPDIPPISYPGVYVREVSSTARTIVGVSTSIAVFIGRARQGPLNKPTDCSNYEDFERIFSSTYAKSDLAPAVRLFFQNGGSRCHVVRIASINKPALNDYRSAFEVLDKEVDLFNLMVLPEDEENDLSFKISLWGAASIYCRTRRAFLLMDAPAWSDPREAIHPQKGVNQLRVGLVKDHSAVFYPRVIIKENGLEKKLGPSGAIAGLTARIDRRRGVWKAPAGIGADLRGIVGLEHQLSDAENGILNPQAVNCLRCFPQGIVNWGARTMDGADEFGSEYKYIPVRRLALFIEESLDRGLNWAVFEPNDEALWAEIRLHVGAFMHNLFRQGAFQGTSPKDAYFVKCDRQTITQDDINRGIVIIQVGFAPLKPAEFVILSLQLKAGQIEA
jgi:phage tail sheath protein FI